MPGFRIFLRIAPLVVGLVAVRIWLRRSEAPEVPEIAPARRFEREPIDIVTVVDDLLLAGQ